MTVNYIEKYNLKTVDRLLSEIDSNKYMATFRANCLSNAKAINERAGQFFFNDDTTKFFNARYDYFHETGIFTHSVRNDWADYAREYRVSWVNPNGEVVDLFWCATLDTARRCARFYHKELQSAGVLEKYYR